MKNECLADNLNHYFKFPINLSVHKCQLLPALSSWENLQKALILLFMVRWSWNFLVNDPWNFLKWIWQKVSCCLHCLGGKTFKRFSFCCLWYDWAEIFGEWSLKHFTMDFEKISGVAFTVLVGKPSKGSNFAVYGQIELKFLVNDPWKFLQWILTKCQLLLALSSWVNLQKALNLLFMVQLSWNVWWMILGTF